MVLGVPAPVALTILPLRACDKLVEAVRAARTATTSPPVPPPWFETPHAPNNNNAQPILRKPRRYHLRFIRACLLRPMTQETSASDLETPGGRNAQPQNRPGTAARRRSLAIPVTWSGPTRCRA